MKALLAAAVLAATVALPHGAGASGPNSCYQSVSGEVLDDVKSCEEFVASGHGTPRQRATALVNLGYHFQYLPDQGEHPEKELDMWMKAADADPGFAEPWIALGELFVDTGKSEDALGAFAKAQKLDGGNWRILAGSAKAQLQLNDVAAALALGKKAAEAAPAVGNAHQVYGEALYRAKDFPAAEREFRKAAAGYVFDQRRRPGMNQDGDPWTDLAILHADQGKFAQAAEDMSRLIDPQPPTAWIPFELARRAEYLERARRSSDAAADYARAAMMMREGDPQIEMWETRSALLSLQAGDATLVRTKLRDLLRSGNLKAILRIQVFLRNNGFDEVPIDGKPGPALDAAIERCLAATRCAEAPGQPI